VRQIGGQIDTNDLDFITERYGKPLVAQPCPISKKDGKEVINPHVSTFGMKWDKEKGKAYSVSVFHGKPIYYLHKNGEWRPLSEVASYYGTKNLTLKDSWSAVMDLNYLRWLLQRVELLGGRVSIPGKSKKAVPLREGAEIFFSTSTFYPAAGTASPVCGRAYRGGVSQAWAAFRAAAGTGADHTEVTTFNWGTLTSAATLDEWMDMGRSIAGFDTSTLGSDTVNSGTFSLYGSGTKLDAFEQSICLVGAEPASDNTVVAGDYVLPGNWGTTELAPRKDVSGLSTSSYEDFTLNADGIAYIKTGDITWMGGRISADLDDVEPTTHPGSQDDSLWRCYSSNADTSKDPKLVIGHSSGGEAIEFDAASTGTINSNTVLTFSHTTGGSDRLLFVAVGLFDGFTSDVLTSVTYNGVSMTRIGMGVAQNNSRTYLYYLINADTGANNVVITSSVSTKIRGTSMSYTGAQQSGVPDASVTGNGNGTTITGTVTTVADNSWLVGSFFGNDGNLAASTGTTSRGILDRNGGFDSNEAITPAGSSSLVVTCDSDNYGFVVASFAPLASAAVVRNLMTLGVGK
jgi:hypothetical protein